VDYLYGLTYNEIRIKISLGSLSPVEYRESLGIDINQSKLLSAPPVGQNSVGADTACNEVCMHHQFF
jgi:hypothetical protein